MEQDHPWLKRLVKPGMGFGSFNTARRTIRGYEITNMIRKGQILGHPLGAIKERILFINRIFAVIASSKLLQSVFSVLTKFLQHNRSART